MCLSFSFKLSCPRLLVLWMSSVLDPLHFFTLQVFSPNVCHPHLLVLQMQLSYPYRLVVYKYLWLLIILAFLFYDYWMFQILFAFLFCDCLVLQIIFTFLFYNYLLFLVVVHGSIWGWGFLWKWYSCYKVWSFGCQQAWRLHYVKGGVHEVEIIPNEERQVEEKTFWK